MPLLTIFLLLAACLPISWPASPLGLNRVESVTASGLAVLVPLTIALLLRTWVVRTLTANASRRSEVARTYVRLRTLLFYFNLACVLLAVLVFGWGATAQSLLLVDRGAVKVQAPFAELLVPLPYFLILFGTWVIYYDAERALYEASLGQSRPFWTRQGFVLHNARQLVLFLMLPVGLFTANQSLVRWWPEVGNDLSFRLLSVAGVLALVILMPLVIRPLLGLQSMPAGRTRHRLEGLSRRIDFRYRDLLLWPTNGGMVNALILGLFAPVRYVIFTDRILDELPPEQIDAVLGHEAGHSLHGHIRYYLVFLVLSTLALTAVGLYVLDRVEPQIEWPKDAEHWLLLPPLAIVTAYLFLVFGFLSRRCERQADVHGAWAISCGNPHCTGHDEETSFPSASWKLCPTGLRTMAEALERVQLLNGHGLEQPKGVIRNLWAWVMAWMHGPIPRRASYLLSLIDHPERERRMQRNVTVLRWGLILALLAILVIFGELVGWETLARSM